jgi:hypothetical protein
MKQYLFFTLGWVGLAWGMNIVNGVDKNIWCDGPGEKVYNSARALSYVSGSVERVRDPLHPIGISGVLVQFKLSGSDIAWNSPTMNIKKFQIFRVIDGDLTLVWTKSNLLMDYWPVSYQYKKDLTGMTTDTGDVMAVEAGDQIAITFDGTRGGSTPCILTCEGDGEVCYVSKEEDDNWVLNTTGSMCWSALIKTSQRMGIVHENPLVGSFYAVPQGIDRTRPSVSDTVPDALAKLGRGVALAYPHYYIFDRLFCPAGEKLDIEFQRNTYNAAGYSTIEKVTLDFTVPDQYAIWVNQDSSATPWQTRIYNLGDVVHHNLRCYRVIANPNTDKEPGVTPG